MLINNPETLRDLLSRSSVIRSAGRSCVDVRATIQRRQTNTCYCMCLLFSQKSPRAWDRGDDYNGKKSVLRVQMDTVKQASIALANAYKLKNYPLPGVYIAKDMTYHQRVKMRELVKTLRWRIDHQPKYRWKIVDWEVVNVGYFKQVQESESKPDTMNRISGSFGSLDKSEVN